MTFLFGEGNIIQRLVNNLAFYSVRIPEINDVAVIPAGINITLSGEAFVKTLGIYGSLIFSSTLNCVFTVGSIMIYSGGLLNIVPNNRNVVHSVVFIIIFLNKIHFRYLMEVSMLLKIQDSLELD